MKLLAAVVVLLWVVVVSGIVYAAIHFITKIW